MHGFRSNWYAVLFAVVLTAFTAYSLLDTFVIEHAYEKTPSSQNGTIPDTDSNSNDNETSSAQEEDGILGSYHQNGIDITLKCYREQNTNVYVADIRLSSLSSLRTAFAKDTFGRNVKETPSKIAADHGAILAVNGDFYGARVDGFVIRDGIIYRDTEGRFDEDLAIMDDGSFRIFSEYEVDAQTVLDNGAKEVFSFGPSLLIDGEISVGEQDEVSMSMESNPRTAIAVYEPLHYAFVVSDGRTKENAGLTLYELARFLDTLGVDTAYNLDGGGSATMVFQGEVVNEPTHNGKVITEREVSDIVYIG